MIDRDRTFQTFRRKLNSALAAKPTKSNGIDINAYRLSRVRMLPNDRNTNVARSATFRAIVAEATRNLKPEDVYKAADTIRAEVEANTSKIMSEIRRTPARRARL
jgi:hypothetical protein